MTERQHPIRTRLVALLLLSIAAAPFGVVSAQIGAEPAGLAAAAAVEVESGVGDDGVFSTVSGVVIEPVVRNGALYALRGQSAALSDVAARDVAALVGAATGFGAGIEQPVLDFLERALPELAGNGPSVVGIERFRFTLDVEAGEPPYALTFALALAEVQEDAFPASRHVKGPADAPIVIRDFSDFSCPACRRFVADVLPAVEAALLPRGDVRIEYHHFPLVGSFPNSFRAAEVSECVADANPGDAEAFWSFHDALFERQPEWSGLADPDATLVAIASGAGVVTDGIDACLAEGRHVETVERAYDVAMSLQLRGTPTVFVGGYQLENFVDMAAYGQAIAYLEAFGMVDGVAD
jgi:protein-disulfide isomerase